MRSFIGKVVSNKMQKSVVVAVERFKTHSKYPKVVHSTKKFMAHDESNDCSMGDQVRIESSRPLSKRKHWVVTEVLRKARIFNIDDTKRPAAAAAAATAAAAAASAAGAGVGGAGGAGVGAGRTAAAIEAALAAQSASTSSHSASSL
ncbi:hypothetical protein CLOM_g16147 [Closterium sp. NIES-68]|nr:hypothetical protein CLOM_g23715 [Closterium sp. NIES-68]GJP57106.1 hypothetical protein CLOM_g16147 [Closterium sp. NIES-68]GJP66453.1 hypothetical protein CLOP_g23385 [Closterium sp. NIES-67]